MDALRFQLNPEIANQACDSQGLSPKTIYHLCGNSSVQRKVLSFLRTDISPLSLHNDGGELASTKSMQNQRFQLHTYKLTKTIKTYKHKNVFYMTKQYVFSDMENMTELYVYKILSICNT